MDKEHHVLVDASTVGATEQPETLNVISATWVFAWKSRRFTIEVNFNFL